MKTRSMVVSILAALLALPAGPRPGRPRKS